MYLGLLAWKFQALHLVHNLLNDCWIFWTIYRNVSIKIFKIFLDMNFYECVEDSVNIV